MHVQDYQLNNKLSLTLYAAAKSTTAVTISNFFAVYFIWHQRQLEIFIVSNVVFKQFIFFINNSLVKLEI